MSLAHNHDKSMHLAAFRLHLIDGREHFGAVIENPVANSINAPWPKAYMRVDDARISVLVENQ